MSPLRIAFNVIATVGIAYSCLLTATVMWPFGWHHSSNSIAGSIAVLLVIWWVYR